MFLVALMILKKAEMKLRHFIFKERNQKTPNKHEQDWYIKEIKRFIRFAFIADRSLQCRKSNASFGLLSLLTSLCNTGASGR